MLALLFVTCLVAAVSGGPRDTEFQLIEGIGYYLLGGDEYAVRWDDAMVTCYFQGAHLAIVNSEQEAEALKNLMANHSIEYYSHIGFSDQFKQGYFVTVKGEPLSNTGYTRWDGGIPTSPSWRCGALTTGGDLTNRNCEERSSFICEKDISTGYELVPGIGYYKLHSEEVTWGEALQQCHLEGSKLAIINSDQEAQAIAEVFQPLNRDLAHVGVHDMFREAFYFTLDGDKIEESGYDKWTQWEPFKTSLLNNVAVDRSGLYHLTNSTVKLPFICEKKL